MWIAQFLRTAILGGLIALAPLCSVYADKANDTLRIGASQIPESLDAYFNNALIGSTIASHIWDYLVYRDPRSNEFLPSLARSWRWIDERTLEFELREGIRFHNGEPFDADDVVYTLNFAADPANRAIQQQTVNWIARVEKMERYRVRIHLKAPFPLALEYLASNLAIYPDEYYKAVGPGGMSERPLGTGPYRVVQHLPGRLVRFERNPDYFSESPRPRAQIGKLEIRLIPDIDVQIVELMAGGLDWIENITPDQAARLKAVPRLTVLTGETMRVAFLQFNVADDTPSPMLKDVRVRRAIAHAIDREGMVRSVVGGGRVLNTVCYPTQLGCPESVSAYAYDPAKARSLLAEAGYPAGFELDLYAYRDRTQMEAVIGFLRAAGVRANLRFQQYAALRDVMRARRGAMFQVTWGSFGINDVAAIASIFFKLGEDDIARDAAIAQLLEEGDTVLDAQRRKGAYEQALTRIADNAYAVPLFSLPAFYAYTSELDFTSYPDQRARFWQARWK